MKLNRTIPKDNDDENNEHISNYFGEGFIQIPYQLAKIFGCEMAAWITLLLDWRMKLKKDGNLGKDNFFYLGQDSINERIGISSDKQRNFIRILGPKNNICERKDKKENFPIKEDECENRTTGKPKIDCEDSLCERRINSAPGLGFLEISRRGLPARNYYKIHLSKIINYVGIQIEKEENSKTENSISRYCKTQDQEIEENKIYNNKENNNISLYKYKEKETSFPDVVTDEKPNNLQQRMEQENETYNKSPNLILEQVETLLQKNSDIQKIIDYWNNLPKPLSDHKKKDSKTYLQICQNLEKLLKKNYSDKITSSIQTYFDLIKDPYFKLSLVAPGVKVDLSNFLNINGYLKTTIKDPDLLTPWFDKCSAQTLDQLKEKYSKETKDLYPDITNALKNEWRNLINENKKFTVAEENFLKKTAISTYNYFKNIKDFKNDTYYKKHYPVTCIKFIIKALLINNPDIEMVPGWLWSDNFFSKVDNYLRKIGYIEDGYDAHISRSPMRTELTKPEDLENIRKEEEEKEKEIRDTCLTSDDFL